MSNEVAKSVFGKVATLSNPAALADAMSQSAAASGRQGSGDFINFSGKRGVYEIGTAKRDADPDEVWLVNVSSFEDGYICWKGGQPMATRLYPMGTPIPTLDRTEHGPFPKDGDGWYDAKSMTLRSLDSGEQGYFKINSVSGVSAFGDLQREIVARLRAGDAYWPVIRLGRENFVAKGFKNAKPVLIVDGWLSDDAVGELAEAFESDEEIDLPALYEKSGAVPKQVEAPKVETASRKRRL